MKRFLVIVVAAAIAVCLLVGCAKHTPPAQTEDDSPADAPSNEYLVYSFNIRLKTPFEFGTRWDARKEDVAEYIDASGADVLCLQEVTTPQYEYLDEALTKYSVIWYPRDDSSDSEGLAILCSDSFEVLEQDRFWLSETPDEQSKGWGAMYPRICVHAKLQHSDGDVFDVYNVHLDHISERARTNGIKLVVERALASDAPAIVAGDFNADSESDCYAEISGSLCDAYVAAPDSKGGYTYNNWGLAPTDALAIDHIFFTDDIDVKVFRVLYDFIDGEEGRYYSDHFAVASRFSLSADRA